MGPVISVQFSFSVVSDSLRPHDLQHARPPCPSPSPRVHSDSHPSSRWCHPAISSSVIAFSSCSQSLSASESFPMSQLFTWGFQSTGVSASASFPPKKSQGSDAYLHSCSWSPRIIESQDQAVFFERSRKQKQKCMGRSYLLFIFVCVFECIEGEILMCVCVCVSWC